MASSPSFLSKAHLGGEAPSSMAYSLMDGASSHLLSFVFRCISMLKDPASIEVPQASFHQVTPTRKNHNLGTNMSYHSSSVNGKGTSHKDPLSRILDELSSLKLWKEKQERKEKGKKRVEEISQDERKKIREEERRKIMKEMKREKHASYSSHNSCKSLSEELRDYYEGRHRSHLRPHSHRREKERKPQKANIKLSYFHGKDNVLREGAQSQILSKVEGMMQSYPARALGRRLQVDWARDPREGPRVLMSLRFLLPFVFKPPPTRKNHNLGTNMSLHSSSSVNGEGSTPKDLLYKILDELRSLKLWKEKQERKEKGKKRVEEISQDERDKIREKERRKILKELRKEKHVSYSSHNSCKSLSEELHDFYEGRHRSHLRPYSHRREKERNPQEANINLPYFHGKDNVEANSDWEIRVEQQLKRKSTSKSYDSHSYPKKDQGQGILGVTPSKLKDDKGKTIEKQPLKVSMQEKTSSMKFFKCLGRGHITSQCPTKKTMIMRGQDIYSSQDEATTSPSSSESEEAKGEESSEEIYPPEEGQPFIVKEKCKEVCVSAKRLAKKERHFEIKTNIKEIYPLRQPPHFLLCKNTLVSIATPLRLEFIPQVKELLDEGLVRKSLNPCALLVPKIGIIRHQIPKIWTRAPNIFMICVHRDSLGTHMGHLSFLILFGRNNQHENTEKMIKGFL
ncbi:hypothetical protein HKD37_11G032332 [Glycine soja]